MRFSQCEVKVIHSCWRHLLLCCPPESDPAWGWGCCTEAGWDSSCHWASFQKKLPAMSHLTSPGEKRGKTKGWGRWRYRKVKVPDDVIRQHKTKLSLFRPAASPAGQTVGSWGDQLGGGGWQRLRQQKGWEAGQGTEVGIWVWLGWTMPGETHGELL